MVCLILTEFIFVHLFYIKVLVYEYYLQHRSINTNALIYRLDCIRIITVQLVCTYHQIKYDFIVSPTIDQRGGQLCLPHIGITNTEKIELTDQQVSTVNGL